MKELSSRKSMPYSVDVVRSGREGWRWSWWNDDVGRRIWCVWELSRSVVLRDLCCCGCCWSVASGGGCKGGSQKESGLITRWGRLSGVVKGPVALVPAVGVDTLCWGFKRLDYVCSCIKTLPRYRRKVAKAAAMNCHYGQSGGNECWIFTSTDIVCNAGVP